MNKRIKFFLVNLGLVILTNFILFLLMNGRENEYPIGVFGISILISMPIIYVQYPILNFKRNWIYKSLIFYSSMVIFLFIFGITIAWNVNVGSHETGTWLARLDSGLRMIIFGQIIGGFLAFLIITSVNFVFKSELFNK